jgi:hypothetical protein
LLGKTEGRGCRRAEQQQNHHNCVFGPVLVLLTAVFNSLRHLAVGRCDGRILGYQYIVGADYTASRVGEGLGFPWNAEMNLFTN